jgi:general stress protein YciG
MKKRPAMNAIKQKAGKAGGLATLAKHGKSHFSEIGRRGAVITWLRYELRPAGIAAGTWQAWQRRPACLPAR